MILPRPWAPVALLVAALAPGTTLAQESASAVHNTFYASLGGMYVVPSDSELSATSGGFTLSSDAKTDAGFGAVLAVGYGSELGLRGEVEFGYRQFDLDKISGFRLAGNGIDVSLGGEQPYQGDVNTLSLMANGIYAFEAGRMRPYVGIGVGLARHDVTEDSQTILVGDVPFAVEVSSSDDVVFAYQAIGGISFAMSETTEARLGYRYFATGDADFDGTEVSYGTHNFEAGILFRFRPWDSD